MNFELILCDVNADLCHEWRSRFRKHGIEVQHGDIFEVAADAYVSPANSHGIMDGGFDLLLRNRFPGVDVRVQREIDQRGGMLPVGHAVIVETGDWDIPYLVSAPTMEIPSVIAHTNNVFLAMRGLLRAVHSFNGDNGIRNPKRRRPRPRDRSGQGASINGGNPNARSLRVVSRRARVLLKFRVPHSEFRV